MKRYMLVIMMVALASWAVAQSTGSNAASSNAGNQNVYAPGAVPAGGLSTNTGTAVIIAPPSAPLMVTPQVHLTTVNPAVGATNATPGNTAGAANATTAIPVQPTIITTVPQYATAGSTLTQTAPPQEALGAPVSTPTTTSGPIVVTNNGMLFDRGVGSGTSLVAGGNTGGKSLGEIAREYRQRDATMNAHVYTNQDIQRINQQPGVTVGGMTGAAVNAGNASQAQPSANPPAVSQPTTNQPQTPGVSQPVPPTSNPPQSQVIPPAQSNQQIAQATPPSNPAEQQPSSGAQGGNRSQSSQRSLPAGGSILPLMGLVGFLAAGAGLLSR